jgi:hypothetical protein
VAWWEDIASRARGDVKKSSTGLSCVRRTSALRFDFLLTTVALARRVPDYPPPGGTPSSRSSAWYCCFSPRAHALRGRCTNPVCFGEGGREGDVTREYTYHPNHTPAPRLVIIIAHVADAGVAGALVGVRRYRHVCIVSSRGLRRGALLSAHRALGPVVTVVVVHAAARLLRRVSFPGRDISPALFCAWRGGEERRRAPPWEASSLYRAAPGLLRRRGSAASSPSHTALPRLSSSSSPLRSPSSPSSCTLSGPPSCERYATLFGMLTGGHHTRMGLFAFHHRRHYTLALIDAFVSPLRHWAMREPSTSGRGISCGRSTHTSTVHPRYVYLLPLSEIQRLLRPAPVPTALAIIVAILKILRTGSVQRRLL